MRIEPTGGEASAPALYHRLYMAW